jgi:hypothetical protein
VRGLFLYVTMSSESGGKYNKEVTTQELLGLQGLNPGKIIKAQFNKL